MNQDIKKQWVEALRSGEYTQGKGRLHDGKNFCCLGVLCGITKNKTHMDWEHRGNHYTFNGESGLLPGIVADACEIGGTNNPSSIPLTVLVDEEEYDIDELNDLYDWTFNDLADLIEEQF